MSAYDDAFDDPNAAEDYDADNVRCKRCGMEGLYWVHTGARWRLMNGKAFHVCLPSADDFEVIK